MNRSLVLFAFLLMQNISFCQDENERVSIQFGGLASLNRHKSFKDFVVSYNSFYGSNGMDDLKSELNSFATGIGYRVGVTGFIMEGVGVSFNYEHSYSSSHSTFKNNNEQHFKHVSRSASFGFDYLKKVHVSLKIGMNFPVIESYYKYHDGTISFGKEQLLNGTYTGLSFFSGLDVGYRIDLGSLVSVEPGISFSGFFMGEYNEYNWDRSLAGYPDQIPTDVLVSYFTPWANYDKTKIVEAKMFYPYLYIDFIVKLKKF